MVKVKICGITNLEDALYSLEQGADALGFVFYKKSPRYIKPEQAKAIIKKLPRGVKKVGVFVNAKEASIKKIAASLRLDILQFHGNESRVFCRKFRRFKVIKAFRLKDKISPVDITDYEVWAYLFDTYAKNKFGGTGKQFNYSCLSGLGALGKTIFLAGGLNQRNVSKALKLFPASWVDASSSLEKYPGKKDKAKLKKFIKNAKAL
ncbi:MAG: phosphoribosylanthranilate isomerase [Candidatus Omnitrophica bacterium]|nr:phosphoribosylanthranilate isomerase [Candidatus Omnitrophota bacterium]